MNIKYWIGRAIIFLLVVFTIQSCKIMDGNNGLECNNGSLIEVPAKPTNWRVDVLTATPINVKKGDTIVFCASGKWDVGLGPFDPNGKKDCVEYPVMQRKGICCRAYLGALIGRIGKKGEPFLIGSRKTITAIESGKLFLGSNDNLCPCYACLPMERGCCYGDNSGSITVCVEVRSSSRISSNTGNNRPIKDQRVL